MPFKNKPGLPQLALERLASVERMIASTMDGLKLSGNQQRFFAFRLLFSSDKDCAEALGFSRITLAQWRRRNGDFIIAQDRFHDLDLPKMGAALFMDQLGMAAQTNIKLMQSGDFRAMDNAVENILRATGLWNPAAQSGADPQLIGLMRTFMDMVQGAQQAKTPAVPVIEGQARVIEAG